MSLQSTIEVRRDGEIIDTLSFAQGLIRIGRSPRVKDGPIDVILPSDRVSGLHAQIVVGEGELTLVDRSRNGTFVNGELIQAPRPLKAGDTIEIDVFTLRCARAGGAATASATASATATPSARESQVLEISDEDLELDLAPEDDELPVFDLGLEVESAASPTSAAFDEAPSLPRPLAPMSSASAKIDLDPGETTPPGGSPAASLRAPAPTVEPPMPGEPLSGPLSDLYRHLAGRFGAGWGRPTRLDPASLPRAIEAARLAIATRGSALADGELWTEWLARELCGLDPIRTLLDDTTVTGVDVHGEHAITVHRGPAREIAAIRFSCVEAVIATIERWTGRRLDGAVIEQAMGGVSLRAFDRGLVPGGPLVIVRRAGSVGRSLADLVEAHALSEAAAELLRGSLARGHGILIVAGSQIDPTELVTALRREVPPERVVAAIQRASTWSPTVALALDGHQEPAALWGCVERLGPDWLIVEELRSSDVAHLRDLGRHRGGGTIATIQARSGDAALSRLAALLAATVGGELPACRAAMASSFDLVVTLRERPSAGAHVCSIAELRGRGELAELFAWRPATSSLEPTGIDSHLSA